MSGYRGSVETMIVSELIPLIDRQYSTTARPSGRVVAGFSMGGAGSVALAIEHPELFCAAASWGGALSRRGTGEDSRLLPAAIKNAATLKKNNFALLTINGDQDHPDGYTPLAKTLKPLEIAHKTVTLQNTNHNLGKYYERAGATMLDFLAAQLTAKSDAKSSAKSNAKEHPQRTVRVLTIGNSFAGNACKYLKQIAAAGDVNLLIGTANLGGCTLERHATLARQSRGDASIKPYGYQAENKRTKLSLQEYLQAQPWDYVTLQQMSALSHRLETYHPHIDQLVAEIRKHAPQAEILIHQTWAYRPDAPLLKEWKITQSQMHTRLAKAYDSVAGKFNAAVLPVGDAFNQVRLTPGREVVLPASGSKDVVYPNLPEQKNSLVVGWHWRTSNGKQTLRLDFKHANAAGCYLAGLVWYETITGNDARKIDYTPRGVQASDASFYRSVAHDVASKSKKTNRNQNN